MNLSQLITVIQSTHEYAQHYAQQQVNKSLSIRNWVTGYYLFHFEQNGEDRAAYGTRLYKTIAENLKIKGLKGYSFTALNQYRQFYQTYPHFIQTVSELFIKMNSTIVQTASEQLQTSEKQDVNFLNTLLFMSLPKESTETNKASNEFSYSPDILITRLSFSHFIELIKQENPLKRVFYEVYSIKNNWSVRELERAMNTLLFERTGLSTNKEAVIAKAKDEKPATPVDVVKNPYFLEFLGLEEKPEYSENDLEQAIINHLQKFLVELGRGFCFEYRQKRITFDNKHYKIDLVFYNRILKCHVLLDLKVGAFDHADAGQMNMYLNYYRKNEMTDGDNPPVGIILCANKNDALVEYATSGLPQEVFVSKYLIQLPSIEELKQLIESDLQNSI